MGNAITFTPMIAYKPLMTNDSKRYVVMRGGTGSGKTYHCYMRIVSRIMTQRPCIYLCLRKHATSVRHSIWHGMTNFIINNGLADHFAFYRGNMTIKCKNGNEIWFGGLDDPQKLRSIEGVTDVWMEESDAFTTSDFTELDRRFRAATPHNHEILITFNPVSTQTWMYQLFYDSDLYKDKTLLLHTTYKDNPHLDPEVVEVIQRYKVQDPYMYKVFGLGEWGILSGRIYDVWEVNEIPDGKQPNDTWYGLDFGYNNPTALVQVDVLDGVHYISEKIYQSGLTLDDIAAKLKAIGLNRSTPIYCDSADPASIEALYRSGLNAKPAKKDVKAGIMHVKALQDNIRLHPEAGNISKELSVYRWEEDKYGNTLDRPVKVSDHAMDAIRYALYTHQYKKASVRIISGGFKPKI